MGKDDNGFKLLAIRPLEGCSQRYLKVLKAGQIYKFYNDYEYLNKDGQPVKGDEDVINIKYNSTIPTDLYNIKREDQKDLKINFTAVVGKNGSGKSSLIELVFMAINNIAKKHIDNNVKPLSNVVSVFEKRGVRFCVELYFSTYSQSRRKTYKIVIRDSAFDDDKKCKLGVFVEVLKGGQFAEDTTFNIKDFFYTIAINYSSYSLDSRELGDWIKELFWKNDAYQTPIVINPFREDGHIDHENEKGLVKDRLLVNVLRNNSDNKFKFSHFTDKQKVKSLSLKLNSIDYNSKVIYKESQLTPIFKKDRIIITINDINKHKKKIFKILEDLFHYDFNSDYKKGNDVLIKSLDYIFYKAFKIGNTYFYEDFKTVFDFPAKKILKEKKFAEFIKALFSKEGSHITFKIRQTINFILYSKVNIIDINKLEMKLNIDEISENINDIILKAKKENVNRIEFIPPPIYDIDYNLISTETDEEREVKFSLLSSGEQQRIYSVSSILYHLINIDSVKGANLIKYKNVNIIFEEIELYFHPEMQRTFVSFLHNSIKNISLKNIESINITLVTHSPFILSDIPDSNILYLEVKKGDNDKIPLAYPQFDKGKTFGANIHDLLANSFFMEGGFMGEFAKKRINNVIDTLKITSLINKEEERISKKLTEKKKLSFIKKQPEFKELKELKLLNKEDCEKNISIVGEPMLYMSLMELYSEAFNENKKDFIQEQINKLQKLQK